MSELSCNGVNAKLGHIDFCSCDACWKHRVQDALKVLNPEEAQRYSRSAPHPVAQTSRGR